MNKEAQLYEMAELMCGNYSDGICAVDGAVCNHNCEYKLTANHLQRNGYRKCNTEIYYVIRNLNTGEYWRGKGGMWGKYYNQAVIYRIRGQAEFTLRDIQHQDKVNAEIVPIQIMEVKTDDNP